MGHTDSGQWTVTKKLRWLIVAPPCGVLLLTAMVGIYFGWNTTYALSKKIASVEMDGLTRRVEDFFTRAVVLPRTIAVRQKAFGREPYPKTMDILKRLLDATPQEEAQGVYIAFEDKGYLEENAIQWIDRNQHTWDMSHDRYDFHERNDNTEWYWGAKDKAKNKVSNDYYISEPYVDKVSGVSMVSVTTPVSDDDEKFIGVAGVDLELNSITKELESDVSELESDVQDLKSNRPTTTQSSQKGDFRGRKYAYIVSKNKQVFGLLDEVKEALGLEKEEILPLEKLPEDEFREISKKDSASLVPIASPIGLRLVSWATSDFEGKPWKVVLNVPEKDVYGDARQAAINTIVVGLLGLTLMIGIVAAVADRVTRPIVKLTAAAAAVEAGDYRPNDLGDIASQHNEFGQLARGFRRMVEVVSAREQQLRQAQESLARSERHYRALIENSMDIISVIEPDGAIRYESPSILRILGYDSGELAGRKVQDFVHPDDRSLMADTIREMMESRGAERTTEYRFRHKDGTWRTLEAKCTNLADDPAVLGIVVNSRDITERKQNEAEIIQLNASLDRRVRLRTAELEQTLEELRGAKEATEMAMKQQDIFTLSAAHDMRNLLTIIIGYGEHLLRRAEKKKLDAFIPDLKLIENKSKELVELINDLLYQSKAMSDKGVELDLEEFDIAGMVHDRMEGIGLVAQKNGNAVEFRPEDGLGGMVADKVKVWRILMNLLTNACKFTRNGKITLTAARMRTEGGDRIVFQVADTGVGMNHEQISKLFDRFAQVHDHSGKKGMGFGLGLSICMLYCKSMGGEISVHSEEGKGTTFTVSLPAVVTVERPAPVLLSHAHPTNDAQAARRPGRPPSRAGGRPTWSSSSTTTSRSVS